MSKAKNISKLIKAIIHSPTAGTWRLIGLCTIVGLMAGLGSILFHLMLEGSRYIFLETLGGYHPTGPTYEKSVWANPDVLFRPWIVLFLPALGGLLSCCICHWLAPETAGHGTDAAISAYHHQGGFVRKRVPFIKALTAAITIGAGGSAGAEGPITQIGAGFGSTLASMFKLRTNERRILMAAGMSAGVGAIFHAPLAGALFAAEVFYRELDLEFEVIIPAMISSTVAYVTFASVFGWNPLFGTGNYVFNNFMEIIPYLILALVVSAGAALYVKVFDGIGGFFKKLPLPFWLKAIVGGVAVGAIGLLCHESMGTSYGVLQKIFDGQATLKLLLMVALLKIVSTSLTIGSGGSGGVFGPAMVIGGCLGGATGMVLAQIFPALNINPAAFAIVGMAGFFASAANTPISTIILVSEMTGNYHLLVPSMVVCFFGYLLTKRFTIYGSQLPNRFSAPVHIGEMLIAVLHKVQVFEIMGHRETKDFPMAREDTPIREVSALMSKSSYHSIPVLDANNELCGVVEDNDLRMVFKQEGPNLVYSARDVAHKYIWVTPNDDLYKAVSKMSANHVDELFVVSAHNHEEFLAIITNSDIVNAYHLALQTEQQTMIEARLN